MWDCEKCKAQNEDNFDTCWSCQTFFESRVSDSTDHQLKIKEDDQKIAEEKKREAIINKELDEKGFQIWSLAIFSYIGIFAALLTLFIILQINIPRIVLVAIAFYAGQKIKKDYKTSLRKKIIEELEKDIYNKKLS